ncbi:MAG: hypothetical protein Kow0049_23140 [Stanieria sp.]
MKKHYLLHLNPHASHEWDRCVLRNPLTGERPDLVQEISQAIAKPEGSYLISVTIDVEVLEQVPLSSNLLITKEITPTKTTITTIESTQLLAS